MCECVFVGFVMCGYVCLCGFCNVWMCLCVGFVKCGCVCVCVCSVICGSVYVWIF